MSILTKIFVVLVTFLSVALVALIVPFVAKVEDYKAQLTSAEQAKIQAEATARVQQAEKAALAEQESQRIRDLTAEKNALVASIATLSADKDKLSGELLASQAEIARNAANTSRLTAANQQFAAITQSLQDELKQRREQMVELQTRIISLGDRNDELVSQLDSLKREVNRFKEQMASLQDQNRDYERAIEKLDPSVRSEIMGTPETSAASRPFMPPVRIGGSVTNVQSVEGDTWVQINIGSNDGVEKNMKFWIHRGGKYMGTLVISAVDANASAGRMDIMESQVSQGDSVLTGADF